MLNDLKLTDYPTSLEWMKKTSTGRMFSGSYSKDRKFQECVFLYRVWMNKDAETEEKTLKVSCCIKPAGIVSRDEYFAQAEETFEFSKGGLEKGKEFLEAKLLENRAYFD